MLQLTHQRIINSPLNSSKTKYSYSIAKAKRFRVPRPKYPQCQIKSCPRVQYDIPDGRCTRATSFGFGDKYDFTKPTQMAADYEYEICGSMNTTGKSFGLSREQLLYRNYLQRSSNPGPGRYEARKYSKQAAYSIRPKTFSHWIPQFLNEKFQDVPGPGKYESIGSIQKNPYSKYRNTTSVSMSSHEKRFSTEQSTVPGPGEYSFSSHKGSQARFGSAKRNCFIDKAIKDAKIGPGPGNYDTHSDFGYSRPQTAKT